MMTRQDALTQIATLAQQHGLTLKDIAATFKSDDNPKSGGTLTKILGYIGGIFIFCGVCIFAAMEWDSMNSAMRVIITLGSGFCAFLLAVVCTKDKRYLRATTPLFLMAGFLQPAGILVALTEYSRGGDPAHGFLFMTAVMALQQGLIFLALRRTVLAFLAIAFGTMMTVTALDLMDIDETLIGFVIGFSLMCLSWVASQSRHRPISGFYYFFGAALLLISVFDWVEGTALEVLYIGLTSFMIYISTIARSRTLLAVGTIGTIGFIGYYSAEHFEHVLGWPLLLILLGFILLGMSSLALKLNKKYIK